MKRKELADKLCIQPNSVRTILIANGITETGRYSNSTLQFLLNKQRVKQLRQFYKKKTYRVPVDKIPEIEEFIRLKIKEHETGIVS